MTRTALLSILGAAALATPVAAQTPPRDADLNALPPAARAAEEPTPTPAPQPPAERPQAAPSVAPAQAAAPPVTRTEAAPAAPASRDPAAAASPAPPPASAASPAPAAAPRALDRAEIAELPFSISLVEGMTLTAGRAAPGAQTWTARRDGRALLMIYAGPSSLFPIHDGQIVEAGGRMSVVIVENGRRRAVEHLYLNATDPRHLHVWIAAGEGADRDQAEALAHSVAPR